MRYDNTARLTPPVAGESAQLWQIGEETETERGSRVRPGQSRFSGVKPSVGVSRGQMVADLSSGPPHYSCHHLTLPSP